MFKDDPYGHVRNIIKSRPAQQFALTSQKIVTQMSGTAQGAGLVGMKAFGSSARSRGTQFNMAKFGKGK